MKIIMKIIKLIIFQIVASKLYTKIIIIKINLIIQEIKIIRI